jgi:hypothetical protein
VHANALRPMRLLRSKYGAGVASFVYLSMNESQTTQIVHPHFCFVTKSPWKIQSDYSDVLHPALLSVEETFCPISTGREAFYRTNTLHLIGQDCDPVADRHVQNDLLSGSGLAWRRRLYIITHALVRFP